MPKLDESFIDIRLDEGIGPLIEQYPETDVSNQVTEQPQEEREPTRLILRKNHPECQIIRDPSTPQPKSKQKDLSENKVTQLSFQKWNPSILMML